MVHITIVDDNPADAELFQRYLERYQKEKGTELEVTRYQNGAEFLEHYSTETDIVFMDIDMPVIDGMGAAHALRKLDPLVVLIFTTNLTQYAVQGYEVSALDYLVKPVTYSYFSSKMDRAMRNIPVRADWYVIPTPDGPVRVSCSRIYYIESNDHVATFHTADGVFQARITLRALEEDLRSRGFSRPNNSFLVNLSYVEGIQSSLVQIRGQELSIGRGRRKSFLDDLSRYLGGNAAG